MIFTKLRHSGQHNGGSLPFEREEQFASHEIVVREDQRSSSIEVEVGLDGAKHVFGEKGANTSLEQVAREAEVSIASLYRHFPTPDSVISAVYRQEVDALIEAADRLVAEHEPEAALREWLMLFVEFLDAKHGMAEAMDILMGGPEDLYSKTPDRLASPITALVTHAVEAGAFQSDVEPPDLLRALSGVATIRVTKNWKHSAVRMVDLLLAGMSAKAL